MIKNRRIVFLFLNLIVVTSVQAQDDGRILPKGVFRFRAVGVNTRPIVNIYGDDERPEGLIAPLNRQISQQRLMQGMSTSQLDQFKTLQDSLEFLISDIKQQDVDNMVAVDTTGEAELQSQQLFTALEYGISERWNIGIKVPFIKVSGKSNFGASFVDNTQELIQKVKDSDWWDITGIKKRLIEGLREVQGFGPQAAQGVLNAMFTDVGYQVPKDFEVSGIGDVELGAKFQYVKSKSGNAGIEFGFRLPTTTHTGDQANLLDPGLGDDQLDFAVKFVQDYSPTYWFQVAGFLQYEHQFEDSIDRYVQPHGWDQSLDGLVPLTNLDYYDDDITRKLGDNVNAEVSMAFKLWNGMIKPHVAYQYKLHFADEYSGGKSTLNYASMSENSEFELHSWQVGLNFSTVPLYLKKKFFLPGELRFKYNQSFAGRNTIEVGYARMDFVVYFK